MASALGAGLQSRAIAARLEMGIVDAAARRTETTPVSRFGAALLEPSRSGSSFALRSVWGMGRCVQAMVSVCSLGHFRTAEVVTIAVARIATVVPRSVKGMVGSNRIASRVRTNGVKTSLLFNRGRGLTSQLKLKLLRAEQLGLT